MLWLANARLLDGSGDGARALGLAAGRVAARAGLAPAGSLDLGGAWLLPGLVNAHEHLHLNVFPRTAPGRPYRHSADWVRDMAAAIQTPAFRALRALPLAARAWQGGLKNALAGATTVLHHDPWLPVFEDPDFPVTVVRRVGWAHSPGLAGRYGPGLAASRAELPPGRPWFLHLAEGSDARAGAELGILATAGLLDADTRLVHGVGLRPADVDRALAAGAGLVWCPASNDFLLGTVADPRPFAERARAALGSDSRLTGARDLLDELRFAAAGGRLPADALLAMVTSAGAALVGRPEAGHLALGAAADLLALADTGTPPAEALAAARRADLRLVVAGGRPLLADPDLAGLFERAGEPALPVRLDGRDKWLAWRLVAPLVAAGIEEPGLALLAAGPERSAARAHREPVHA